MSHRSSRQLRVDAITRVEGEGALNLTVHDGQLEQVELNIYEPPRFFEALLRGRSYTEPPDLVARICGICPVAYQLTACQAIEAACWVAVGGPVADLRRLLYCGEWISSHALHIYLLHAPDFLGYPDAISLAADHRPLVERGLRLKKAGNAILEQLGGRAIHPINVRLGGFYRVPTVAELAPLADRLRAALEDALATVAWVAGFDCPDVDLEPELLSLYDPAGYPIERGAPRTAAGGFPVADFDRHVVEEQVAHSTALHATLDGGRYLVGPLARYSLNSAQLSPLAREAAAQAGLGPVCRNPFRSIVVRAVEVVYALDEALRLIGRYQPPDRPYVEVPAAAGVGYGATEAPRGLLYHRFELAADGTVLAAQIVPPTSQNQAAIEDDVRAVVAGALHLPDGELTALAERAIRNHDPCISCAAHFLRLTVDRT